MLDRSKRKKPGFSEEKKKKLQLKLKNRKQSQKVAPKSRKQKQQTLQDVVRKAIQKPITFDSTWKVSFLGSFGSFLSNDLNQTSLDRKKKNLTETLNNLKNLLNEYGSKRATDEINEVANFLNNTLEGHITFKKADAILEKAKSYKEAFDKIIARDNENKAKKLEAQKQRKEAANRKKEREDKERTEREARRKKRKEEEKARQAKEREKEAAEKSQRQEEEARANEERLKQMEIELSQQKERLQIERENRSRRERENKAFINDKYVEVKAAISGIDDKLEGKISDDMIKQVASRKDILRLRKNQNPDYVNDIANRIINNPTRPMRVLFRHEFVNRRNLNALKANEILNTARQNNHSLSEMNNRFEAALSAQKTFSPIEWRRFLGIHVNGGPLKWNLKTTGNYHRTFSNNAINPDAVSIVGDNGRKKDADNLLYELFESVGTYYQNHISTNFSSKRKNGHIYWDGTLVKNGVVPKNGHIYWDGTLVKNSVDTKDWPRVQSELQQKLDEWKTELRDKVQEALDKDGDVRKN